MIAACLLHAWSIRRPVPPPTSSSPGFVTHDSSLVAAEKAPRFETGFVGPSTWPMAHSSSIGALQDGQVGAVWYAGSREGAGDVAIYFAERSTGPGGQWSTPVPVVTRQSASEELRRYVKKLGNPVVFRLPGEEVGLIYVSVSVGGWSGSSLNLKRSRDGGRTWSPSRRLTLSPFLNIGELVRTNPLPLRGGGVAIPLYHEFLGRFPEVLWLFTNAGDGDLMVGKTRMFGGREYIQPSAVPLNAECAVAFMRDMSPRRSIAMSETSDGGLSWSRPRSTDLPNPDAGIHAIRLSSGYILMAFNDTRRSRENLKLAVSRNGGRNWGRIITLEEAPGAEFSYPSLARDAEGLIHLVYTWRRNRIKHAVFNEAWIENQLRGASW